MCWEQEINRHIQITYYKLKKKVQKPNRSDQCAKVGPMPTSQWVKTVISNDVKQM